MATTKLPAIPEIEDEELREAVSALCRSASSFHRCFVALIEGKATGRKLVREHSEHLLKCEAVLSSWRDHLGITVEELFED